MSICTKDLFSAAKQAALADSDDKRSKSKELVDALRSFLSVKPSIPTGLDRRDLIAVNKQRIMDLLRAEPSDWDDWKWQMAHRIDRAEILSQVLYLEPEDATALDELGRKIKWSLSPYYLSLMSPDPQCPIRLQGIPQVGAGRNETAAATIQKREVKVNLKPTSTCSPSVGPNSMVVEIASACAVRCHHCGRNACLEETDGVDSMVKDITETLNYIKNNPNIKDVLFFGGDLLMHEDDLIDWVLSELDEIPHLELKRIGTRVPSTLPQRITPSLVMTMAKHRLISITTQFNSPLEITYEAKEACARLADAGIPMTNKAVRLPGVNNNQHVMKRLNQVMLQMGIKPVAQNKYR